jgi:hypothetical protein
LPRLRFDQPVYDFAPLHQQPVQRSVDTIDLDSEICESLETGLRGHVAGLAGLPACLRTFWYEVGTGRGKKIRG